MILWRRGPESRERSALRQMTQAKKKKKKEQRTCRCGGKGEKQTTGQVLFWQVGKQQCLLVKSKRRCLHKIYICCREMQDNWSRLFFCLWDCATLAWNHPFAAAKGEKFYVWLPNTNCWSLFQSVWTPSTNCIIIKNIMIIRGIVVTAKGSRVLSAFLFCTFASPQVSLLPPTAWNHARRFGNS